MKKKSSEDIHVNYNNGKVVSVEYETEESSGYTFHLKQNDQSPILGNLTCEKGTCTFIPIVAFTAGQTYEIRKNKKTIESFTIDHSSKQKNPELIAIYPSMDTVPQNLLKMYFVFSHPMQHSKSALDFISVFDNTAQKESDIFLEMETELWNKERTRLTLWLDPGRIKTDLIPNQEKGPPLLQKHCYTISIDSLWTSEQGYPLTRKYVKMLNVVGKDLQRPNPKLWEVNIPKENTQNPLEIRFNEPMDAVLILETIQVKNREGELIEGTFSLLENELKIEFKPEEKWILGNYSVHVNPVLEDLAGNNLERLFDTDLSDNSMDTKSTENILNFSIEH
ncbi:Ig-like domain-containing protein [Flagellimonas meridianipacifica]|uniref:Ig-like domain-containing protein n=1 Tax=Flagellimonas meridianipacifica TaxID=1080225 RepID=UPI0011B2982B|nr:Ig-like domain-containing protein [Allomuricauda pacifica]